MVENSRKRKRNARASSSSEGDDESKKRGRPRVEKQDESAADRRRTQIRMAQRAYRQRKESTLEALRKRVSELTNTLELMNQAFAGFRDRMSVTASDAQLIELRNVSGQYEDLMKVAYNPGEEDYDLPQSKERSSGSVSINGTALSQRRTKPKNLPSWLDQSVLSEARKERLPGEVGLGYTMYLGETGDDQPVDYFNIQEQKQALVPKQHQQTVYDALTNLLPDDIRIPRQLPTITTYSFHESSFARRLHRACLKVAHHVLLDPSRRQSDYERIFRLSLMGRDTSKLTTSLKTMLSRGIDESLDFWEAPLIHVGGAGTHYPRRDQHGNLQARKSSYNLGLVGPQTLALLESAAKNNLSTDITVETAGYEGEWFDPYDVEGYLEERGIHIDSTSSFVEAEIYESDSTKTASSSLPATPVLEYPTQLHTASVKEDQAEDFGGAGSVDIDKWNDMTFTGVGYSDALTGHWMNFLEPGQGITWLDDHTQTSHTQSASWDNSGTAELMQESVMEGLDRSSFKPPQRQAPPMDRVVPRKKSVIIDTSKLVKALTRSGVCLGRTPGYKRRDVDRALAMASFDL